MSMPAMKTEAAVTALPATAAPVVTMTPKRAPRSEKYAKMAKEAAVRVMPPLIVVALLLLIWELICRRAGSTLPPPSRVFKDTRELILDPFFDHGGIDKGLFWHLSASLQRVAYGYSLAAIAGIALGTLVGQSVWAMRGLDPLFQVLRTIPPLAWLPLSLAAFRDGQPSAIFVIFITSIWPIIINTAVGIRNIPQDYRNVAAVVQLNPLEFFSKIMIPAAAPYIFTGLRIGIGLSWLAIVAAEMLIGGVGIGFFIWDAWNSSHISEIILALFYVGIIGFVLDRLIAALGKFVTRGTAAELKGNVMQAYLKLDHIDKILYPRQRHDRSAEGHQPDDREGRIRLDHRPFRLRQVHAAQHRRRPHRHDQWRRAAGKPRGQFAGAGSRGGVPEPQPAAVAHGLRKRQARRRQGVFLHQDPGRARRLGDAQSQSRADGARQGQASQPKSPAA